MNGKHVCIALILVTSISPLLTAQVLDLLDFIPEDYSHTIELRDYSALSEYYIRTGRENVDCTIYLQPLPRPLALESKRFLRATTNEEHLLLIAEVNSPHVSKDVVKQHEMNNTGKRIAKRCVYQYKGTFDDKRFDLFVYFYDDVLILMAEKMKDIRAVIDVISGKRLRMEDNPYYAELFMNLPESVAFSTIYISYGGEPGWKERTNEFTWVDKYEIRTTGINDGYVETYEIAVCEDMHDASKKKTWHEKNQAVRDEGYKQYVKQKIAKGGFILEEDSISIKVKNISIEQKGNVVIRSNRYDVNQYGKAQEKSHRRYLEKQRREAEAEKKAEEK